MNPTSSPASLSQRAAALKHGWLRFDVVILLSTCILFSVRLFVLINNHAVNILYWDQWGYFQPLFEGKRWWQLFGWQIGPWRLGASILSYLLAELTHWNSRAEAFFIGALVWLAMMAALWLKRRLFGKLVIYDVAIPMIVLTTAQFQAFAGSVSSAPAAFPVFLIVLYCLAWTVEHRLWRYGLVLLLNLLLVYTGYALFMGGVTIALLAVECWRQRAERRDLTVSLFALLAALLTVGSFLVNYDFDHFHTSVQTPGQPGQRGAHAWEYPVFASLMFGRFVRMKPDGINWLTYVAGVCGIGLFVLSVVALLLHWRRVLAPKVGRRRVSLAIVILLGYELLFVMSTALGRARMGLNVSQSSRFVTLMIPAFLGLYFHLLTLDGWRFRRPALLVFLLLLVPGHLPLGLGENHPASAFSRPKRAWRDCYLRTEDFAKCEAMSELKLLPLEPPSESRKKLDYLKQHKLNLYSDQ
jgi:hypothetical protein